MSGNSDMTYLQARRWYQSNYSRETDEDGNRVPAPIVQTPSTQVRTDSGGAPVDERYRWPDSGRPTGGGSGRGSGGRAGPIYVKPDEDAVREQIKMYVVAVTGQADEDTINSAVEKFMSEDRRGFDQREKEGVDPWVATREIVRNSSTYKTLHNLRPESVNELDWVTQPQARLLALGVSSQRAQGLAQRAAQRGSSMDPEALEGMAQVESVRTRLRMHSTQRESMRRRIAGIMRYIK